MIKKTITMFIDKNREASEPQYPGMYKYLRKKDLSEEHMTYLSTSILTLEKLLNRSLSEEELDEHFQWSYEYFGFYKWLSGDRIDDIEKLILPPKLLDIYWVVIQKRSEK